MLLSSITITGNTASRNGGGIYNDSGASSASISVNGTTLSGNSAQTGGGFYNNSGIFSADSDTVSTNSATIGGGAGFNAPAGMLTVTNSTFSGNTPTPNPIEGVFGGGNNTGL
jgi:predicted outer membrane repeat protein